MVNSLLGTKRSLASGKDLGRPRSYAGLLERTIGWNPQPHLGKGPNRRRACALTDRWEMSVAGDQPRRSAKPETSLSAKETGLARLAPMDLYVAPHQGLLARIVHAQQPDDSHTVSVRPYPGLSQILHVDPEEVGPLSVDRRLPEDAGPRRPVADDGQDVPVNVHRIDGPMVLVLLLPEGVTLAVSVGVAAEAGPVGVVSDDPPALSDDYLAQGGARRDRPHLRGNGGGLAGWIVILVTIVVGKRCDRVRPGKRRSRVAELHLALSVGCPGAAGAHRTAHGEVHGDSLNGCSRSVLGRCRHAVLGVHRVVGRRWVEAERSRRIVIDDGPQALVVGDGGVGGPGQLHGERLVVLEHHVTAHQDVDRLGGVAGGEH